MKLFHSLIFIFCINCFGYLKPIPIIENEKNESLKTDIEFFILDENEKPIIQIQKINFDKEIKKLQQAKQNFEKNNLAVYGIKLSYIDEAEKILISLTKEKKENQYYFLNLLRLNYLLDEYDECRKIAKTFYLNNSSNKKLIFEVLDLLQSKNRIEEKVIILDTISSYPDFKSKAIEELGTYFLENKNYTQAKFYFEKLLSIYAFHKQGLLSMMRIHLHFENWKEVVEHGQVLERERIVGKKFTNMQSKAYYELGEYDKAIKLIEESNESEKLDIEVLTIWRDSIHILNPNNSADKIKKYFNQLKKYNLNLKEDDFFTKETETGKKNSKFIYYGF